MISFIINAIKIIFLLGFLIFIHEGGHFIVSKLCRVKVNEFAIGFGPIIWQKQGKETKYTLRLIPLGGFNSLEGEEEYSDKEGSFSKASIGKRMAIILAGGFVNIIFGIIIYFILMTSVGNNVSLVVDDTIDDYAAEKIGIVSGDEIIKINDKKVNVKTDLDKIVDKNNGEELKVTIKRDNEKIDFIFAPTKKEYKSTGIYLKSVDEDNTDKKIKIITVEKNSAAEKQGLKANDKILKINGIEVKSEEDIINTINNGENEKLIFTIQRLNETLDIELTPDVLYKYYLGVTFKMAENNLQSNLYYAVFNTRDFAVSIFENLKMLFTGNVGIDQMMGPVGISEAVASTTKVQDFVYLFALISLSLGVTNLLPFPALDGGRIVLLVIEVIRGKKLKQETESNINFIGFMLLILLAIIVTFNDIMRIL